jgi:hypothetical protein
MTPKKARVKGTVDFLEANGIPHFKSRVFQFYGVGKNSSWNILRQNDLEDSRTYHLVMPDRRGRKKKISDNDLSILERFIDDNGFDGRTILWAGLPAAVGLDLDVYGETVRNAVKTLNLRFCITCEKKYASPRLRERRVDYARVMLERYPHPTDWRHIRFSDECHFGWGP